jgi:hypothetical protein
VGFNNVSLRATSSIIFNPIITNMKSLLTTSLLSTLYLFFAPTLSAQNTFPATGNVGIGTTTPAALLDIGDTEPEKLSAVLARVSAVTDTGSGTWLGVRKGLTNSQTAKSFSIEYWQSGNLNTAINFHRGASVIGGFMTFSTGNGIERMRIDPDGNIGIGTTTPGTRLAVNGDISAKGIKITQSGWPDYVFDSSYPLMPLQQLEQYISREKHLPEIPDAATIEKKGLDVGEMQALLLKKVEEITLHLIEIKNTNNSIRAENEAMRVRIAQLKKKI